MVELIGNQTSSPHYFHLQNGSSHTLFFWPNFHFTDGNSEVGKIIVSYGTNTYIHCKEVQAVLAFCKRSIKKIQKTVCKGFQHFWLINWLADSRLKNITGGGKCVILASFYCLYFPSCWQSRKLKFLEIDFVKKKKSERIIIAIFQLAWTFHMEFAYKIQISLCCVTWNR